VFRYFLYFGRSPELIGVDDIRAYQLHLVTERKLAPSTLAITVAAPRFFYKVTLGRDWIAPEVIPMPKIPDALPQILSPEEVLHFLETVPTVKHRTILTSCYAAGLRVSEAVGLKSADIDSQRMVIRVDQGKGRQDRYVMLTVIGS
jgi:integrase/recombinase XerD